MITFLICVGILIGGYFTYGTFVDKILAPNDANVTPAKRLADGIDYLELPWWKLLLTQFLNVAGLGPIFGAISGALFGPVAFIWITFGCLFVGAVHDLISGFISMRHDGSSMTEVVGIYLGKRTQKFMIGFTFVLIVLVGVTFTMAPANWLQGTFPLGGYNYVYENGVRVMLESGEYARNFFGIITIGAGTNTVVNVPWLWVLIIMAYYLFATIIPVEPLIAKLFFPLSIIMLLTCVILLVALFINMASGGYTMMEFTFNTPHPGGLSPFPFIFTTIACGAVSGFHATKSPIVVRCLGRETEAKRVFFGSMIIEGIVALIWAAIALAIFGDHFFINGQGLTMGGGGPGGAVNYIAHALVPNWLAITIIFIAVIIFPVTTADTGFRSARLMFADAFKWNQSKIMNRVLVAIPIFVVAWTLTWIDFGIIWRYFAWSNLSIAAIILWVSARYLVLNKKFHWIASIPAVITTAGAVAYILQAPEGFAFLWPDALKYGVISNVIGFSVAIVLLILFLKKAKTTTSS